jgi:transcriptional regulator with XRE-family HTH domain
MIDTISKENLHLFIISENLKRLRSSHNLTTAQVAAAIHKSRQGYANYEAGNRDIGVRDLMTLADFYGVTIDDLVGNPFSLRNDKPLSFRSYERVDGQLQPISPITISTVNDDVVLVRQGDNRVEFYWKTQKYHKGRVMLFDYYDRVYTSKVHFHKDGGGFFTINDEPFFFTKANAENIVYLGVFGSSLRKDFSIPNFF